jgi:hypothetical protein
MSDLSLFADAPAPATSDASREAWDRIRETLSDRERAVFVALVDYVQTTGFFDATGGELAAFAHMDKTSTRPRLTGLCERRLIRKEPIRNSRAEGEGRCHPYRPEPWAVAALQRGAAL